MTGGELARRHSTDQYASLRADSASGSSQSNRRPILSLYGSPCSQCLEKGKDCAGATVALCELGVYDVAFAPPGLQCAAEWKVWSWYCASGGRCSSERGHDLREDANCEAVANVAVPEVNRSQLEHDATMHAVIGTNCTTGFGGESGSSRARAVGIGMHWE